MLSTRYRFKVQPLYDRDETAILVFRDSNDHGYTLRSEVLTIEDGWIEVIPNVSLPMEKIPTVKGIDIWYEQRMLDILDKWEQHIRDAVQSDTDIVLHDF